MDKNTISKNSFFSGDYRKNSKNEREYLFSAGTYDVVKAKNGSILIFSDDNDYNIGLISLIKCEWFPGYFVETKIHQEYRGLSIAPRVYEGLIKIKNYTLISINQSIGARKTWDKLSKIPGIKIYGASPLEDEYSSNITMSYYGEYRIMNTLEFKEVDVGINREYDWSEGLIAT